MLDEDQKLISEIAAGGKRREAAMKKFFEKYASRVKLHFLRHKLSADDASDLLQEVMLKVIKGASSFRSDSKVSTWLWTITHHTLVDFLRQPKWEWEDVDDLNIKAGDSWEFYSAHESQQISEERTLEIIRDECVEFYFSEFSKRYPIYGQALRMKAFDGMNVADISKVLKRSEGATREFLSQCRKKLKDFLKPCQSVDED